MFFHSTDPPPKQQHLCQERSSTIGTDEFERLLGSSTSMTYAEEEYFMSSPTRGRGICSPSRFWDAFSSPAVDKWSRRQIGEASSDVSKDQGREQGREQGMEQEVLDTPLYSDEHLYVGFDFGGGGRLHPQSLQEEDEFVDSPSSPDGVNAFCFEAYEADDDSDERMGEESVWLPEQAVPDSTILHPDGSDEWIHESCLESRESSEGGGSSGGYFEWGSTDRTRATHGTEIYGSGEGNQDADAEGLLLSSFKWSSFCDCDDVEISYQQTLQGEHQQQRRLCDVGEEEGAPDVQQDMDDTFSATTMTTVGLSDPWQTMVAPPISYEPTQFGPPSDQILINDIPPPIKATPPFPHSRSSSFTSTLPQQQRQRRHRRRRRSTSPIVKPTTPIPSTTSRATEFMSTIEQPRDWILEQLEGLAGRFLYDLSLGVPPVIELACRSRMDAIIYDEEVGVIRRRRVRAADAVMVHSGDEDADGVGLLKDTEVEQVERDEEEVKGDGAETMETTSSGTRRKAVEGSGLKEKRRVDNGDMSTKTTVDGIFNISTATKSPLPPPPVISSPSSPFTQRSVYGSSRTSRILRAIELIHENVCKDTISSKRDTYYRDVMTFGCQPAVDGIVEDLACTLEVPRSSLNVVAGTRSVVFGSVRILVKALGGRQRETSGVKGGGECEECEEVGQLPWLHEEIADSPFSKAQTSSNNKQSHQRQEEEGCDPLDSRFSQTNYNTLVPIPVRFSDIVEIEIHPRTRFVLVIEKEATFSNLISLGFYETHGPCILLTSKGYPDQVVRQLLKALSEMVLSGVYLRKFPYTSPGDGGDCRDSDCDVGRSSVNVPSVCQSSMRARRPPPLEIPLLALMDCDPQGIEIYLTYRCGSIKSAYENANLAVPALKCLGQFPSDWDLVLNPRPACTTSNEAHLGQEQENENDEEQERSRCRLKEAFISLTVKDRKKLERLLTTHPYICQHTQWKNQIARMLEVDAKTEIQSLHQLTSTGSGAFVVVGGSEGESEGGGNIARGAEGEGELPSSSALVLYLQRKLQDPESWL